MVLSVGAWRRRWRTYLLKTALPPNGHLVSRIQIAQCLL
jgi:hypothetical protein